MKESLEVLKSRNQISRKDGNRETAISILPVLNAGGTGAKSGAGLHDHWRAVRRRLWMIAGVTILSTLLAAVYMARQQDVFEAQARVQVDLENNPAVGVSGKSSVTSAPVNDPTYFSTQLQILMGSGLLRRVVKTLDLEHNRDFRRPQSQNISTWRSLKRMVGLGHDERAVAEEQPKDELPLLASPVAPPTASEDLEEARRLAPYVSALQKNLIVEPVKDTRVAVRETRLIDIRFSHQDPHIAAKVANAIANALVLSNLEQRTATSAFAGDFLQKRIAELQTKIRSDEERLLNYAQNNKILSLDPGQNTVVERLAGLNRQLLEAENNRKAAEAAYRTALAPGAADALVAEKGSQISGARATLAALRQRRALLLAETTEEWPEVKEIDKQIVELQKQIADETNREGSVIVANLQTKYHEALANEQSLREAFNQQRAETLSQNQAAINYKIIEQEIGTSRSLLDGLLQRSKENDVILAAIPNNIHVTDYALTPQGPVGPQRLLGVSIAFVCSLFFGVGLALLMGQLDDAIYSQEEMERLLDVSLLAAIPPAGKLRDRFPLNVTTLQRRNGKLNGRSALLINADVLSQFSEAYRKLRISFLKTAAGTPPKTVLVTSSIPAEGKTTTVVNAAMVLASTGLRVLVIDADLRHPSHHSIFGMSNDAGLTTILSGSLTKEDIFSAIKHDSEFGVSVLTAGPQTNNPSELMGSDGMERLIATVAAFFDHIIIDAPPVAYFADSAVLASLVDGVVLVVGSGKTSRKVIMRSQKELLDVGANILGVVLNNVKMKGQDYYSYYNKGAAA